MSYRPESETMRYLGLAMSESERAVWIIAVIHAARDVVIGNKIQIWDDTDLDFFEEWERQLVIDA